MPFIRADRVADTTLSTGTGPVTVSGTAAQTFRTFSAVCAVGDDVGYCIAHRSADEWETGIARYTATNELTRIEVYESSNSNAAVNFSSGTKDVLLTMPARLYQAERALMVRRLGIG